MRRSVLRDRLELTGPTKQVHQTVHAWAPPAPPRPSCMLATEPRNQLDSQTGRLASSSDQMSAASLARAARRLFQGTTRCVCRCSSIVQPAMRVGAPCSLGRPFCDWNPPHSPPHAICRGLGDALADGSPASSAARPWALTSFRAHAGAGGGSGSSIQLPVPGPAPELEASDQPSSSSSSRPAAAQAEAAAAAATLRPRPPPGHTDFEQRQVGAGGRYRGGALARPVDSLCCWSHPSVLLGHTWAFSLAHARTRRPPLLCSRHSTTSTPHCRRGHR